MANGRVLTGFSKPYVALYSVSSGSVVYSSGQILARGVSVNISLDDNGDNVFYADNGAAETASQAFTSGAVQLVVDGLNSAAEALILGLPTADSDGWTHYGDSMSIPYVGVGMIARYMSGGVTSYVPVVLTKTKFQSPNLSAVTQEEEIDWQTQELNATILRDDSSNRDWKIVGTAQTTETSTEAMIKTLFSIT